MEASGEKTSDKSDVIKEAVVALQDVRGKISVAMREHARLETTLPDTLGAPPSSADFPSSGTGVDTVKAVENQKALTSAKNAYAAKEAAIAEAERIAAQHVQDIDASVDEAEPKVRALYDDGSSRDPVPAGSSAAPGSYSDVAAAQAKAAGYNSGVMYPGGWGQDLKAAEMENIKAYEAENRPEWDGSQWINADGTAAPATSYAMVETADGVASTGSGAGGMSALAVAGGGALLGAGVAKAIASRVGGAASARAATAGAASRSATAAKSAAARAGAAGARAGAPGAAGRSTGAGARGAGAAGGRGAGSAAGRKGPTGAGSRAGMAKAGSGGGAAGRGAGRKKDDKRGTQDQDYGADYTADWTENVTDVIDPEADRGRQPKPQPDGRSDSGEPKSS